MALAGPGHARRRIGRTRLTIHPLRFGYVTGGLVLLLDALIVAIGPAVVHGFAQVVLATVVVVGIALYGLNDVLVAAVARIVVDHADIEVRNQLGRRRRFARSDVTHAARRSVVAPAERGIYQEELVLLGRDARVLARMSEADYGPANLERLVKTLGLEWPRTMTSRAGRRFEYQTAVVAILVIVAVGLGLITFAVLTR